MISSNRSNPLLEIRFQIPFDEIRVEDVQPAIEELLRDTRERLDQLTSDPAPRTFANTMDRLDHLTDRLEYAMQLTRNLEAVATTPELRAAYNIAQPQVSEFFSSLPLNDALWRAVQAHRETTRLTVRQACASVSWRRPSIILTAMEPNWTRRERSASAEIDVELTK